MDDLKVSADDRMRLNQCCVLKEKLRELNFCSSRSNVEIRKFMLLENFGGVR